ncbi:MAG: GNAT family N-acetyltransferase [Bacteroidales bacterium]|nr:GNAT family N-acetyltransferase [Bacteroidales bacterium]
MSEKVNFDDFRIRTFHESDYKEITELWDLTGLGGAHRGDNINIILNTIRAGGVFFILEQISTKKIVGTAWITNDQRRLYLHHFGIHPEFQGKKLSHLLAQACIDYGKNLQLQMKLEVHKNNIVAKKLYEQYKFKPLEDYEVFIIRQY